MICEALGQIGIECVDMANVARKMRMIVGAELFLLGLLLIVGAFIALACPGKMRRLKRDHIAISLWTGIGLLFAPVVLNPPLGGCGPVIDVSITKPSGF